MCLDQQLPFRSLLVGFAALLLWSPEAVYSQIAANWDGSGFGGAPNRWSDPTHWIPSAVPNGPEYDVTVGSGFISVDGDFTAHNLTGTSGVVGSPLQIAGAQGSLTLTGNYAASSSFYFAVAALTIQGNFAASLVDASPIDANVVVRPSSGVSLLGGNVDMNPIGIPGGNTLNPSFSIAGDTGITSGTSFNLTGIAQFRALAGSSLSVPSGSSCSIGVRMVHDGLIDVRGGSFTALVENSVEGPGNWTTAGNWIVGQGASIRILLNTFSGDRPISPQSIVSVRNRGTLEFFGQSYSFDAVQRLSANEGTIRLRPGARLQTVVGLSSTGTVDVGSLAELRVGGEFQQNGGVVQLAGGLIAASGVSFRGASFKGSGSISGSVTAGSLADMPALIELGPGGLRIDGDFSANGAVLAFELNRGGFTGSLGAAGLVSITNTSVRLKLALGSDALVEGDRFTLLSGLAGLEATGVTLSQDSSLSGVSFVAAVVGNDLVLTVIPEPSVSAILMASCLIASHIIRSMKRRGRAVVSSEGS